MVAAMHLQSTKKLYREHENIKNLTLRGYFVHTNVLCITQDRCGI